MEAGTRPTMVWSNGLTTICRLCMQRDGFLLAIFNNYSAQTVTTAEQRSIHRKISECTALELSSGDGLPPCICHRCLYKVELCLEFRQQCLESDAILRQHGQAYMQAQDCNGEGASDQESEDCHRNIDLPPDQTFLEQNVEDVVMVVDPTMDYDSENESDFEQHVSDNENVTEHLKNVFMCKYCDKAYTAKDECKIHETTAHNYNEPFRCTDCDMGFSDRTVYTAHQKSVHGNDKPFSCPECERSFSRRSDLRKHTVVHTGIKPFTCHICTKSFSRNTNLTKHLRIHSGHKPYICPQCPKTFISKGDLTRHAIIHSGQRPFACSYCDQSFGRRDKLLRHEKRHTQQMEENSDPDGGSHWLAAEQMSQEHVKQESEELNRPEENEEDDHDSWNGENMVINVDPFQGHNYEEEKEETPLQSEENHSELPSVPEHITADSNFVPAVKRILRYPCLVCHKKFSTNDSLRSHMKIHNSSEMLKPHTCHLCYKSFLRKRELDRHITTHTGMKPFKCTNCDKRFGRKDKLVRHMRIHETGKASLHICQLCGVSFARKDSLAQHMRTHNTAEEQTV